MQKSEFPKMRHYVGFSQIGSHIKILWLFSSNRVLANFILYINQHVSIGTDQRDTWDWQKKFNTKILARVNNIINS